MQLLLMLAHDHLKRDGDVFTSSHHDVTLGILHLDGRSPAHYRYLLLSYKLLTEYGASATSVKHKGAMTSISMVADPPVQLSLQYWPLPMYWL